MDYKKIYDSIIERGKYRTVEIGTYYELHHIIPRCMDGSDDEINLVKLTYREHFLCHWLLHNLNKENVKIEWAFRMMAYGLSFRFKKTLPDRVPSSRILEEKRVKHIQYLSSDEQKCKVKAGKHSKKYVAGSKALQQYLHHLELK